MSRPKFGHEMTTYFALDPHYTNLNHGSFGAVPKPVLDACNKLSDKMEANPDYFIRIAWHSLLNDARSRLAQFIGAERDECVFVPNVLTGVTTVLRNFEWNAGDVLIMSDTTFNSISRAAQHIAATRPHPVLSQFVLRFPVSHSTVLDNFRAHLRSITQQPSHPCDRKVVAVFDSIVSTPGVLLPWREMVRICREEGVWSVVDAAHSLGQEQDLDLRTSQPDFWISSCAKWLYAQRGSALLYVPRRNQHMIRTAFPSALSWMTPSRDDIISSFESQFYWNGTIDLMPFLSVHAALDFRAFLGGEDNINAYCRALAREGGARLAEIMGTRVMDLTPDGELTINMVNVELPLSPRVTPSADVDRAFQHKLLVEHRVYAAHFFHNGRWWARASAQVYNEIKDFDKLGRAFLVVCKEIAARHAAESSLARL
ncbi:pyridoxal phosphate-dependent transferase [Amylocystis lapponica]|nr:pyridoxal phosphate-dependent transferase [Amylocystis lapponica]